MLQLPIILCRCLHFIFKHSMQMFVKILCQHKSTDKSEYIFCKRWRSGKSTAAVSLGLVLLQRASGDAPPGLQFQGSFPLIWLEIVSMQWSTIHCSPYLRISLAWFFPTKREDDSGGRTSFQPQTPWHVYLHERREQEIPRQNGGTMHR